MSDNFVKQKINQTISSGNLINVDKMQDVFLEVTFRYQTRNWNGAIPIKAKYQGINIPTTKEDIIEWTKDCFNELDPGKYDVWQQEQNKFWENTRAHDSKAVFIALNGKEETTKWHCRICGPAPKVNPQPAARILFLKKSGFFIATKKMYCSNCGKMTHFDLLIRLPRKAANNEKRSSLPRSLEKRIKEYYAYRDACFDEKLSERELVIDHKFPSSRWVQGEEVNDTSMTDDKIQLKFQLLTNQINLQKERYCQRCVSKGIRGDFFGITWYYKGDKKWRGSSKADEAGCVGCYWYDLVLWKDMLMKQLKIDDESINANDKKRGET